MITLDIMRGRMYGFLCNTLNTLTSIDNVIAGDIIFMPMKYGYYIFAVDFENVLNMAVIRPYSGSVVWSSMDSNKLLEINKAYKEHRNSIIELVRYKKMLRPSRIKLIADKIANKAYLVSNNLAFYFKVNADTVHVVAYDLRSPSHMADFYIEEGKLVLCGSNMGWRRLYETLDIVYYNEKLLINGLKQFSVEYNCKMLRKLGNRENFYYSRLYTDVVRRFVGNCGFSEEVIEEYLKDPGICDMLEDRAKLIELYKGSDNGIVQTIINIKGKR